VVIGVFVGAPLISRELESGTFRFTWTQGVGRTGYVLTTLALLAAAAAAATCTLGVLLGWYAHPFDAVGIQSRWQPGLFDTTPLTLPGWTLAALGIGTFLGTLTGRIVAAMAATAAAAGGLRLAAFWNLDHRLLNLGALATHAAPAGYLSTGPLNQSATPGFGPAGAGSCADRSPGRAGTSSAPPRQPASTAASTRPRSTQGAKPTPPPGSQPTTTRTG
jgi:hypothetical protein